MSTGQAAAWTAARQASSDGTQEAGSTSTPACVAATTPKEAQCIAILDDIGTKAGFVIVGGDFNSFTKAYVNKIEERYRQAGFVRASAECGYTFVRFGMQMFTDQIFAKGFVVKEAGKIAGAIASDHVPVWSTLVLK